MSFAELREFLTELRENWNDHYWWARHQALQIAVLSTFAGLLGLFFKWLEVRMEIKLRAAA